MQMELMLFDTSADVVPSQPVPAVTFSAGAEEVFDSDNLLVQELIDKGVWLDIDLLTEAKAELREDVREACTDPDSFLAHETRVALKLVSERLRSLQA